MMLRRSYDENTEGGSSARYLPISRENSLAGRPIPTLSTLSHSLEGTTGNAVWRTTVDMNNASFALSKIATLGMHA